MTEKLRICAECVHYKPENIGDRALCTHPDVDKWRNIVTGAWTPCIDMRQDLNPCGVDGKRLEVGDLVIYTPEGQSYTFRGAWEGAPFYRCKHHGDDRCVGVIDDGTEYVCCARKFLIKISPDADQFESKREREVEHG